MADATANPAISADRASSLAVSSNLHPSGFDEIMPKTLATATVDRLLHHAHIVVTQGDSHRLSEAITGRGVVPLT
jgi:DNA replication protein DnaC